MQIVESLINEVTVIGVRSCMIDQALRKYFVPLERCDTYNYRQDNSQWKFQDNRMRHAMLANPRISGSIG